MFNINFINKEIKKNSIFNKIIFFEKIDSTNNLLKEKDYSSGTIALAEVQLSGRGKFGKKWISEKGGLWFSFVLKRRTKTPYIYVILASVALLEVLKNYKLNARIKWPNDILVNGKKISGILVENDYYQGKVITGIGININNAPPKNTEIPAISLRQLKKQKIDINDFFIKLIKRLDFYVANQKNQKNKILNKWIKNQVDMKGKEIKIIKNNKVKNYSIIKIDKSGHIIARDINENGKIKKIKGEVFFI